MSINMIPDALQEKLKTAQNIVVLTGAGVSAESGIPTFRDAMTGIWENYDPMVLASPQGYDANPGLVTQWYDVRRLAALQCDPNDAHIALADMEKRLKSDNRNLTLITQNIDGLHKRAGSQNLIEMHGNLSRWRGRNTGTIVIPEADKPFGVYPPLHNDEMLRPDVVWFGEVLDNDIFAACGVAIAETDLFIAAGTSGRVAPANLFLSQAKQSNAMTCLINLEDTPNSDDADHIILGNAGTIFPMLLAEI